jgi:hypothetical protein
MTAFATLSCTLITWPTPAVWSAKRARRKAAAAVLRQILSVCTGHDRPQA